MGLFSCQGSADVSVREPAVAGQFYPGNPARLKSEIETFVRAGKRLDSYPPIIISPHAGYVFSGPVAGIGFATVNPNAKKVILIGPSHRKFFQGVSIPDVDAYETPLGNVPLDKELIEELRKNPMVHAHADAHAEEHCLEVQIPFLQVVLSQCTIVPVICGKVDPAGVAQMLLPLLDDQTLVVTSSDFSHYNSHEKAGEIDAKSINTILSGDKDGPIDACGEIPIRVVMHMAEELGLSPTLLDARNSYETAPQYGSSGRVVGYGSIVYLKESGAEQSTDKDAGVDNVIGESDKRFMLKLARAALNAAVRGASAPNPEDIPETAQEPRGCFVTLTINDALRGCIGYIEGIKPLYQAIIDNARNAALSDPRFPKVTPDELGRISVEVSVLTKPRPLAYTDPDDLLAGIVPGEDGIILQKNMRQSTFLPQVWEQLPDKVQFLEHLAAKAGLAKGDWKTATYKRYRAIHFEEP